MHERLLVAAELDFDLEAEAQRLRESALWKQGKHTARTLLMHPDLRVVLLVMPEGSRLKTHKVAQRITVQALAGTVKINLPDRTVRLARGGLVALDRSIPHDVLAVQDSTLLLSLAGGPAHPHLGTHPLDALTRDHQRFAKLLDLMSAQIAQLQVAENPDYDLLRDIFDYMTNYPDRVHHPHEDVIFARVVERAPFSYPLVEKLTQQHKSIAKSGARFLVRLQSALDGAILTREAVEQPALEYLKLYREHMRLEEEEVFPLCREHLRPEDWQTVAAAFAAEPDPGLPSPSDGRYRALHRQMVALLASLEG